MPQRAQQKPEPDALLDDCPFCGTGAKQGPAVVEIREGEYQLVTGFIVVCRACGAHGPGPEASRRVAIKWWNMRRPTRGIRTITESFLARIVDGNTGKNRTK